MGNSCSACSRAHKGTPEIALQNTKPLPNALQIALFSSRVQKEMEPGNNPSMLQCTSFTKTHTQSFFELKYVESYGQSENGQTFSQRSEILAEKHSDAVSVSSLGLRQIRNNYLDNLLSGLRPKRQRQLQSGQDSQLLNPLPSNQLRRLPSVKSQSNKIQRELFTRISHDNVNDKYVYHTKIGQGGFGYVYKGYDKFTRQERAIKIIKKKKLSRKCKAKALFAELDILRQIDHPNIIKLYDVFEYESTYYVVTEYCDGGQLLEDVRSIKKFTEGDVANIMTQIMSAVNYLHKKGIVHRDLKPQNIIFESRSQEKTSRCIPIKIIDFGTATYCRPGQVLKNQVGSPYYVAPEVINQEYGVKCDVWSSGIIMYVLLSGQPPFKGRSQKAIFEAILQGKLVMQGGIWGKISAGAKDLLRQMLQPNPHRRVSAQGVLKHAWMTQLETAHNPTELEVLDNMEKFYFKNKFSAVIKTFLATKTLGQEDRRLLTNKFREMDKDNSGVLQIQQVIDAYRSIYGQVSEVDVMQIIENIDTDHSGNIQLTEFIVATIQAEKLFKRQALQNAWDFFDKDKNGYLNVQELGLIIGDCSGEELVDIMREVGNEGEQISKDDFMRMFESHPT